MNTWLRSRGLARTSCVLFGVYPFAVPAAAQQTTADTLPAAELAPVVVEVFRTPVVLDRVPFSASVVGEERIRPARPGLALDEALRVVPGVQVDNRHIYALGERISVRGFGARAQFGVRGLRVVADGIPATFADGQTALEIIDPAMLGRAEVIRGPASALYGNAAGGVIALRSPPAEPVPLSQEYRVVAGGNGLRRGEARWSGSGRGVGYRLGVSHFRWAGFREHSQAEHLRASGGLELGLGGGSLRLSVASLDFDAQNPGALPWLAFRDAPDRASPMNVTRRTGKQGYQRQLGLGWTAPVGSGELELTAFGITRWIRNPIVPFVIDLDRLAGGGRAAYRFRGPAGSEWAAGLDLDVQRDDRQNYLNANGEIGALTRDQRERVRNLAPSVQLSAPLAEPLRLMAGLRHDRFRFEVQDRGATEGAPDDSGQRAMSAWSPSVGLLFAAADALALFANLATAFETPTTTELANRPEGAGGFNPELQPQRTASYEAGARGRFGAAGYQLAVYRARVRNALIPFEVPDVPGRTFFRNAGVAVHRGIEVSTWWRPVQRLAANLAYTFTDAAFDDYVVGGVRHDGNRMPGVAPHRFEAALLLEGGGGPLLGLDFRYQAATPADDANTEFAPAFVVIDLRGGYEGLAVGRARFDPFAGVTNLLDRRYAASIVPNATAAPGSPRPFFEPAPGRSFYLGLSAELGRSQRGPTTRR